MELKTSRPPLHLLALNVPKVSYRGLVAVWPGQHASRRLNVATVETEHSQTQRRVHMLDA